MNDFIQERKPLVILIVVILFLLLGLVYFYMLKPIKDEANLAETNVERLENDIQVLQTELEQNQPEQTKRVENSFLLERKMPLDRSIDDFILSLQEIELISESRIENISFHQYDGSLTKADQVMEDESEATNDDTNSNNNGETTESPLSDVAESLPMNVKLMTVNLKVVSPNFEQFERFLHEVEKLERITRVDTLSFRQPGEEELLNMDNEDNTITTDIQITTFYYDENGTSTEE
jgi:type IV pilus assembly protein PilO